LQRKKLNAQLI